MTVGVESIAQHLVCVQLVVDVDTRAHIYLSYKIHITHSYVYKTNACKYVKLTHAGTQKQQQY